MVRLSDAKCNYSVIFHAFLIIKYELRLAEILNTELNRILIHVIRIPNLTLQVEY